MKLPHEKLVEDTTELEMLKTEVSMLESENKELRECLNEFISNSGFNKYTKTYYLNNHDFSEAIIKVKQLLNK